MILCEAPGGSESSESRTSTRIPHRNGQFTSWLLWISGAVAPLLLAKASTNRLEVQTIGMNGTSNVLTATMNKQFPCHAWCLNKRGAFGSVLLLRHRSLCAFNMARACRDQMVKVYADQSSLGLCTESPFPLAYYIDRGETEHRCTHGQAHGLGETLAVAGRSGDRARSS